LEELNCESVLITRGQEGMDLVLKDGSHHIIPARRRKVYDVSGAGDTVISVFTLGIVSGLSMLDAAKIANEAAGKVVEERGTTSITLEKLKETGVLDE
jgi:D-beta-D-heptose 7-phosphate kinase/D-beta-D-heptose 1-phosphate adenosyltransferase